MNVDQLLSSVTGEGQALAYFVAYLKKMLPSLSDDIMAWCDIYGIDTTQTSDKFYIWVSKTGQCPSSVTDYDLKLTSCASMADRPNPRAGDASRKLTRSMHAIQDVQDDKTYYFCGEFAGPVKTMRDIFNLAGVTGSQGPSGRFEAQVDRFVAMLRDLTNYDNTRVYAEKFVVIQIEDECQGEEPRTLSEVLLQHIKADISQRLA